MLEYAVLPHCLFFPFTFFYFFVNEQRKSLENTALMYVVRGSLLI